MLTHLCSGMPTRPGAVRSFFPTQNGENDVPLAYRHATRRPRAPPAQGPLAPAAALAAGAHPVVIGLLAIVGGILANGQNIAFLVSLPLAFIAGIVGTLTSKRTSDEDLQAEMEVRSMTGAGAEGAVAR
jgi:hypothetical protein